MYRTKSNQFVSIHKTTSKWEVPWHWGTSHLHSFHKNSQNFNLRYYRKKGRELPMEPIDIICMEMDDITKSGIANSEIFFLESGDGESVLSRIKTTIKKIIDKFIEGIKKIMGKTDDDKLKAAVRDIPELKNEKIEISDTAKRDKAYDILENDIKKAKTVSDVEKVKEKSSKFNAKAVAITVSVAAAATIAVVVLPKRIKTFQNRSELSMKIDKELINEANKRGQRVDDLTDRMNKEIQNIKKDSLLNSEDKKKRFPRLKVFMKKKSEKSNPVLLLKH